LGDLKQLDLRVEIRHKVSIVPNVPSYTNLKLTPQQSNFSNEHLRQIRRNKFMCELLRAMRSIPIDPPGGNDAVVGSSDNPTYSVTVSDSEAAAFRDARKEDLESKRLFPAETPFSSLTIPEGGISSAWETYAPAAVAGVTGRRGPATNGMRPSQDTMRNSRESRREGNVNYGPAAVHFQPGGLR
jgi:hypothetical protein